MDTLAGFDPAAFRTNITNTMVMGLNSNANLQPTFYFNKSFAWPGGTILDSEGKPVDGRIQAVVTQPAPVKVPCAVEFVSDSSNDEEMVGTFRATRALLTLLDTQYALISAAIEVDIDNHRYIINDMHTVALGPVNVYQLMCFRKGVDG